MRALLALTLLLYITSIAAPYQIPPHRFSTTTIDRRSLLVGVVGGASSVFAPRSLLVGVVGVSSVFLPPPLLVSAYPTDPPRVPGVGLGFDLLQPSSASQVPLWPESMKGSWTVTRTVVGVDGDKGQAGSAWSCIGGGSTLSLGSIERYKAEFIEPPEGVSSKVTYTVEGEQVRGVISDLAFEIASRSNSKAAYRPVEDWRRVYFTKDSKDYVLEVVLSDVMLPNPQGWGSNELIKITAPTPSSILGSGGAITRCARVQRKFRRGYNESGARVVEGIEVIKTYRCELRRRVLSALICSAD